MFKIKHSTFVILMTVPAISMFNANAAETNRSTPERVYPMSSDRNLARYTADDRQALKAGLVNGMSGAAVRQKLAQLGFRVTAVNESERDYVEYEVVKGKRSYEIQIDLDPAQRSVTQVEIASNLWRADSTEAALRGAEFTPRMTADYSDRRWMGGWNQEKEQLEKALGVGQNRAFYASQLTRMGYTVSAVNDNERDYVEYEIVKGDNSYEVQIDFDTNSGKSTEVDVTMNLWEADSTEKLKAR